MTHLFLTDIPPQLFILLVTPPHNKFLNPLIHPISHPIYGSMHHSNPSIQPITLTHQSNPPPHTTTFLLHLGLLRGGNSTQYHNMQDTSTMGGVFGPLRWDWETINDIAQYSLHTHPDNVPEAIRSKWAKRVVSFFQVHRC